VNSWNSIIRWDTRKACNLLHTSHPPNDSVLATCGDSYCTLLSKCCTVCSRPTKATWATGIAQTYH